MTREGKRETRIIRCPACQRYYRIAAGPPAPGTRLRCSKCGEVFSLAAAIAGPATVAAPGAAPLQTREGVNLSTAAGESVAASAPVPLPVPAAAAAAVPAPTQAPPAAGRGRVLVSTDGDDFQHLIGEVLAASGFALRQARTGDEAWAAIGSWRPHVVLLDVALPGVPSFELCDRVRADESLRGTGLILIASVFQQTRYKRAPTSLYGADDYIEKHHIRDWLPDKVSRLLPADATFVPAPPPAEALPAPPACPAEKHHGIIDEREQETLIREELYGPQGREEKGLERLRERLRRYARIIISDIALYNQELVEQGIREGTFSELLKKEIEEGYRLYMIRAPSTAGGEGYYHEAVRDFIAKRTGAHRGGASRARGKS